MWEKFKPLFKNSAFLTLVISICLSIATYFAPDWLDKIILMIASESNIPVVELRQPNEPPKAN